MPTGFSYTFADALTIVKPMVKQIPTSTIDAQMCDIISTDMYGFRPWGWTITNISAGTIPLVDGTQDYSPPANIYRMMRARLVRTDTTPDQSNELTLRKTLAPDLNPQSWSGIRAISNEEAVGLLRLETAVQVPAGVTLEIQGEYQIYPTKVAATTQPLWFPDKYLPVLCEGLLYWYYRLADDSKWADQFKLYRNALSDMAIAEDFPATDLMFPDDGLGVGRDSTGLFIFQ